MIRVEEEKRIETRLLKFSVKREVIIKITNFRLSLK